MIYFEYYSFKDAILYNDIVIAKYNFKRLKFIENYKLIPLLFF